MTTAQHSLRVTERTSLGLYCARLRVPRRGGARPSVGPLPGLPVSQRPLQEDLSRSAENQPRRPRRRALLGPPRGEKVEQFVVDPRMGVNY